MFEKLLHSFRFFRKALEPETRAVGTLFPESERGTGTVGTVFQEPKPEPSPPQKIPANHRRELQNPRRSPAKASKKLSGRQVSSGSVVPSDGDSLVGCLEKG